MSSHDLQDALDGIGFGWAQIQAVLLGGGTYVADGAEVLLIGSVTKAVSNEWNLGSYQRGVIVSVVFIGASLGNLISGWLGDAHGRRIPIIVSYAGVAIFSILSALSQGFWSLVVARLAVGIAFGVGVPAWNTLSGEICPSDRRLLMNGLSQITWCAGELYSGVLLYAQDPRMRDLDWRWLLLWGAAPAVLLLALAAPLLPESPRHLAAKGRAEECRLALEAMARKNGRPLRGAPELGPPAAAPAAPLAEILGKLGIVLGRHLAFSTFVVCFSMFSLNFLYYGGLYAFPQVLPELELRVAPAASLMAGAAFGVPGYLLGMALGGHMGRKALMLLYLAGTCLSTVLFTYAAGFLGHGHLDDLAEVLCQVGFVGNKLFTTMGFLVVFVYSIEIYPTVARTTGTGLCIASGRLGSILCPLLYEQLSETPGGYFTYFHLMALMCVANAILVFFLPYETAGTKLSDHEVEPLNPP
mmetsp:Transcript_21993/g.63406  ORF Transcript_21993/g.63406 Transcript_21993/m.63406 type:complete len:470 (-) Transcript_21993:143-1552(-)